MPARSPANPRHEPCTNSTHKANGKDLWEDNNPKRKSNIATTFYQIHRRLCYTDICMHLWDYDKKTIRKDTVGIRFRLERLINYGIDKKKLPKKLLTRHLRHLIIEPKRMELLKFLLWNK